MSITNAINNFTTKSPKAKLNQGISVAQKAIEKNRNVSTIDPITDDARGATNHIFFLRKSKIWTSKF